MDPNTTTTVVDAPAAMGAAIVVLVIYIVVMLAICAFMWWKVFAKAGKPGWASLVPIYNVIVLLQVAEKPVWWIILLLIPILNLVIMIIVCIAIAQQFGKGTGFAIGLILLSIIFFPILGFGSAKYKGGAGAAAPA